MGGEEPRIIHEPITNEAVEAPGR